MEAWERRTPPTAGAVLRHHLVTRTLEADLAKGDRGIFPRCHRSRFREEARRFSRRIKTAAMIARKDSSPSAARDGQSWEACSCRTAIARSESCAVQVVTRRQPTSEEGPNAVRMEIGKL